MDCSYRNGFFAGGYGDLSVLPDRAGRHLYMAFTSYVSDEAAQGVAMARQAIGPSGAPGDLELWSEGAWRPAANNLPALQYQCGQSRLRQIRRCGKPIMARPYHDSVVNVIPELSLTVGHSIELKSNNTTALPSKNEVESE